MNNVSNQGQTEPSPFLVRQTNFHGWRAVSLSNGLIRLVAVPDIGGRIMAYDLDQYPFLYVDRVLAGKLFSAEENLGDGSLAAWKNYGGDKTWPAPQGWDDESQWHGPPDPVLDSGRYTLDASGSDSQSAFFRMVSPEDDPTGLQITRQARIYPQSTRVDLELSFTNISERLIRWSIWDVVQLRAERELPDGRLTYEPGCAVTTPLNTSSKFPGGFNVMFGEPDNQQWGVDPEYGIFIGEYRWEIGKVGVDSPGGWIAFANSATGHAFTERFEYFLEGEYPDEGVSVECWTVGKGRVANLDYEKSDIYLMETEVLSPLYEFKPGESKSFNIEWGACRCPGPVLDVTEAGCVGQKLAISRDRAQYRIRGGLGAFEPGVLVLRWLDQAGRVLESREIGRASPLSPIMLDEPVDMPGSSVGLVLFVRADRDDEMRELSRLSL